MSLAQSACTIAQTFDRTNDPPGDDIADHHKQRTSQNRDHHERERKIATHIRILSLQYTHVQHPDHRPIYAADRLIRGDIPVVHHERPVVPSEPVLQHLVVHICRHARADGPMSVCGPYVGRNAEIPLKDGDCTDLLVVVLLSFENHLLHSIHDVVVAIEQFTSIQHTDRFPS